MAITLEVKERDLRPRSTKESLREKGFVPAIVYGHNVENTPIAVNAKDLDKVIRTHGRNVVLSLDIDGKKVNALVGEPQLDTFTKAWKHVDFVAVDMSEEVEVDAEIALLNEENAKGVKAGGVLVQVLYNVKVKATPDKLPERVEVDIKDLDKGATLTLGDLPNYADFTVEGDPDEVILTIDEPKTQEQIDAEIAAEVSADKAVDAQQEAIREQALSEVTDAK